MLKLSMFKSVFKDLQDIEINLIFSLLLAVCQTSTYEEDQRYKLDKNERVRTDGVGKGLYA